MNTCALIRTNPRLTGNYKLVTYNDNIWLDSIVGNDNIRLSSNRYKACKVNPNNHFNYDLSEFLKRLSSKEIFSVNDNCPEKIYSDFNYQYNMLYSYGAEANRYKYTNDMGANSISIFAPLYINKDNIPECFIVFQNDFSNQIDSKNYLNINNKTDFFNRSGKIIKIIDLSEKSNLGKYIRNYVNQSKFPDSALNIQLDDKLPKLYYNGIDVNTGVFQKCTDTITYELINKDNNIIDHDDYITNGFYRNNLIYPYIINFNFIVDVEDQNFKFFNYYGTFCNFNDIETLNITTEDINRDKKTTNNQITKAPDIFNIKAHQNNLSVSKIDYSNIEDILRKNSKKVNNTPLKDTFIELKKFKTYGELVTASDKDSSLTNYGKLISDKLNAINTDPMSVSERIKDNVYKSITSVKSFNANVNNNSINESDTDSKCNYLITTKNDNEYEQVNYNKSDSDKNWSFNNACNFNRILNKDPNSINVGVYNVEKDFIEPRISIKLNNNLKEGDIIRFTIYNHENFILGSKDNHPALTISIVFYNRINTDGLINKPDGNNILLYCRILTQTDKLLKSICDLIDKTGLLKTVRNYESTETPNIFTVYYNLDSIMFRSTHFNDNIEFLSNTRNLSVVSKCLRNIDNISSNNARFRRGYMFLPFIALTSRAAINDEDDIQICSNHSYLIDLKDKSYIDSSIYKVATKFRYSNGPDEIFSIVGMPISYYSYEENNKLLLILDPVYQSFEIDVKGTYITLIKNFVPKVKQLQFFKFSDFCFDFEHSVFNTRANTTTDEESTTNDVSPFDTLTEYDNYKELQNPDLVLKSRLTPYIAQWSISNSTNKLGYPYKVNLLNQYGKNNLSPEITTIDYNEDNFNYNLFGYVTKDETLSNYYNRKNVNVYDVIDNSLSSNVSIDDIKDSISAYFRNIEEDKFESIFNYRKIIPLYSKIYKENDNYVVLNQGIKYRFSSAEYNLNNYKFAVLLLPININITKDVNDGKVVMNEQITSPRIVINETFKFILIINYVPILSIKESDNTIITNIDSDKFNSFMSYTNSKDLANSLYNQLNKSKITDSSEVNANNRIILEDQVTCTINKLDYTDPNPADVTKVKTNINFYKIVINLNSKLLINIINNLKSLNGSTDDYSFISELSLSQNNLKVFNNPADLFNPNLPIKIDIENQKITIVIPHNILINENLINFNPKKEFKLLFKSETFGNLIGDGVDKDKNNKLLNILNVISNTNKVYVADLIANIWKYKIYDLTTKDTSLNLKINIIEPTKINLLNNHQIEPIQNSSLSDKTIGYEKVTDSEKYNIINRYSGNMEPIMYDILPVNKYKTNYLNDGNNFTVYNKNIGTIPYYYVRKISSDFTYVPSQTIYPLIDMYSVCVKDSNSKQIKNNDKDVINIIEHGASVFDNCFTQNYYEDFKYTKASDTITKNSTSDYSIEKKSFLGSKVLLLPNTLNSLKTSFNDLKVQNNYILSSWDDSFKEKAPLLKDAMIKEDSNNYYIYVFYNQKLINFFKQQIIGNNTDKKGKPTSFFKTNTTTSYVNKNILPFYNIKSINIYFNAINKIGDGEVRYYTGSENNLISNGFTKFTNYTINYSKYNKKDFEIVIPKQYNKIIEFYITTIFEKS